MMNSSCWQFAGTILSAQDRKNTVRARRELAEQPLDDAALDATAISIANANAVVLAHTQGRRPFGLFAESVTSKRPNIG